MDNSDNSGKPKLFLIKGGRYDEPSEPKKTPEERAEIRKLAEGDFNERLSEIDVVPFFS